MCLDTSKVLYMPYIFFMLCDFDIFVILANNSLDVKSTLKFDNTEVASRTLRSRISASHAGGT